MSNDVTQPMSPPATNPPRANFPVRWEQDRDETLFWAFDSYHAPEPVKVMDFELYRRMYPAADRAWETYGIPQHGAFRRMNGYVYGAHWRAVDEAEFDRELAGSQEKLESAMPGQDERWRETYVPELEAHLAFWESFDLGGATMPRLLEHLDETVVRWERIWGELHLLMYLPALCAVETFEELYRELFPEKTSFDAYRLLQGFKNKTVDVGDALWEVSRRVVAQPELRRLFDNVDATGVIAALENLEAGRRLLGDLRVYLKVYGRRSERLEVSQPSWIEDPTPVIVNLKKYVSQPERDRGGEQAARVAERESAVGEARARLADYPQAVRDRFEFLLEAAQIGNVLLDDHQYWIDFASLYYVRQVILEFGRRFAAAGILDRPDDVFNLSLDELRETATALPAIDRRRLVGAREAEIAYFRTIAPPTILGTPPLAPPPNLPLFRGFAKYGGSPPTPGSHPANSDNVIGNAGSSGVVRGVARVARTLADASRLRPGDVLVAVTTSPSWTPLFATAAAVVTDTGGVLSHAAIVAREYGIPAVVATGDGSTRIKDGQLVEVDGNAGIVRMIQEGR